jgi:kynurenine 3-monooxygenase
MKIVIIGAGIAGLALAIRLKKKGMEPRLFEAREETDLVDAFDERSVNITISHRGLLALEQIGCADELRKYSMRITGRTHMLDHAAHFTPYSLRSDVCLYSIDRKDLMRILIHEAKKAGVQIEFGYKLTDIQFYDKTCVFHSKGTIHTSPYDFLFGVDGARSKVKSLLGVPYTEKQSDYNYKKIDLDAENASRLKLDDHSVAIWPNSNGLFFALPNKDGTHSGMFNITNQTLDELECNDDLLESYFPNLARDIEAFREKFRNARTTSFKEVHCDRWFSRNSVLLMGDAVHAMMPFYAQGANCALEDVDIFCKLLEEHGGDLIEASLDFEKNRPTDAYAICELSRKNLKSLKTEGDFEEYLGLRDLELQLQEKFPEYLSEYSMVAFTNTPYRTILDTAKKRQPVLSRYGSRVKHGVTDDIINEIRPRLYIRRQSISVTVDPENGTGIKKLHKIGDLQNPLPETTRKISITGTSCKIIVPARVNTFLCHHNFFIDPPRPQIYPVNSINFGIEKGTEVTVRIRDDKQNHIDSADKHTAIIEHVLLLMQKTLKIDTGFTVSCKNHGISHGGLGSSSAVMSAVAQAINILTGNTLSVGDITKLISQNYAEESDTKGYLSPSASIGGSTAVALSGTSLVVVGGESDIWCMDSLPEAYCAILLYPKKIRSISKAEDEELNKKETSWLKHIDTHWGDIKDAYLREIIVPAINKKDYSVLFKAINMYTIGAYGDIPQYFRSRWESYGISFDSLIPTIFSKLFSSLQIDENCFFVSSNGPMTVVITKHPDKAVELLKDLEKDFSIEKVALSRNTSYQIQ